jgi:hypothetical protein
MRCGRRTVAGWSGLVLALTVALAGCGSSGVPPEKWARSVCLAVKPWSTQIDASVTAARSKITSASAPEQTKAELVALFEQAQRASADALEKVRKAGTPDVDKGEQSAAQLAASLQAAEKAFGRAAAGVKALSTTDRAAFNSGVVKVGDRLSKDNNASTDQLRDISSKELEKAFVDVPECG